MVTSVKTANRITGYSLLELMLVLALIQGSMWLVWPKISDLILRWQAQNATRQIKQMMEYARWTSIMKHARLRVIFKDRHLNLLNQNSEIILSSERIPEKIQIQWHGFQKTLPLIFEPELIEQHLNGTWDIFIHEKLYQRYVMNRLGHGRYVAA